MHIGIQQSRNVPSISIVVASARLLRHTSELEGGVFEHAEARVDLVDDDLVDSPEYVWLLY